jgi:sugar-specific transcriptional regulator TrmB
MARLDLTPFGFTPTESLVYEVLLVGGPGTGYAIARSAGLARANAYSALEGLVGKGAARVEGTRPKRYRPEPPAAVVARIASEHGRALEQLSSELDTVTVPDTPTMVEIESPRAALQLITHDIARAASSVLLVAPPEAYPLLTPALRRSAAAGVTMKLASTEPVELDFAPVNVVSSDHPWPGLPLICVVDDRSAVLAAREGNEVRGHWSTAPAFVAAARLALGRLGVGA